MARPPPASDAGVSARPRVLAVEDDARNAALLRAALEPAGYELLVAGSLAAARRWLTEDRPDLVLLDVGLPDGSGLDLARELRGSPTTAGVPIIVSSARVLPGDRAAAEAAGCDQFLSKPLNLSQLLSTVARYLAADAGRGPMKPPG